MASKSRPFDTVEAAQEYLRLLLEEVAQARATVETESSRDLSPQAAKGLQIVKYNLAKLDSHVSASLKILNVLARLHRLLTACATSDGVARTHTLQHQDPPYHNLPFPL